MYLTKKTYVQNWNHMSDSEKHTITVKQGGKKRTDIKPERISYIIEQVGYWRKFNALHKWFVDNCGEGVDNCQEMYVERKRIEELLVNLIEIRNSLDKSPKTFKKVKVGFQGGEPIMEDWEVYTDVSKVQELLPPTDGFFFGSTDIDKWYYEDITETINLFKDLLKEENGDYYYQASW